MALFLSERSYAEVLELEANGRGCHRGGQRGRRVRWVMSFLSADKRTTYCLYEADNEDAIDEAARRAHLPADVIVRVDEIDPDRVLAGAP